MITENLSTLKINKLTKTQYEAALAAGTINENELYMTEEANVDLTPYDEHIANTDIHVTVEEKATWDSKSNFSGDYNDLTNQPTIPDISELASKPTITTTTLLTSNWNSTTKTYSFETDYPSKNYDVEVDINGDSCTDEQLEAWIAAKPLSSSTNKINAKGDVPTVDIPIILTVTPK